MLLHILLACLRWTPDGFERIYSVNSFVTGIATSGAVVRCKAAADTILLHLSSPLYLPYHCEKQRKEKKDYTVRRHNGSLYT